MRIPFAGRAHYLLHHARLEAPGPDLTHQATSVGPSGDLFSLWRSTHGLVIAAHRPEVQTLLATSEPPWDLRFVQPLPNGRFVVVEGWEHQGPNAWVLDADGAVLSAENVGGYVGGVFATGSGDIWAGYKDQGVFGCGPSASLSRSGLVRFTDSLRPVWRFPNQGERYAIDDCEGVNVHGDSVWMCPYSRFPVVRVHDDRVSSWRNPQVQTNVGAVLVEESIERVALVATGWSRHPGLLVVGHLGDSSFVPDQAFMLRMPDGSVLPADAELTARGSQLHVLHGLDWYRLDLSDLQPRS